MRKTKNFRRRTKSPELFPSPNTENAQNHTLPNPNDANYRHKLIQRLEEEDIFDQIMERCNRMPIENAIEPITKTYFKASRSIIWIFDQKEITYTSNTLNRKINAERSFLDTIVAQRTVTNIVDIDDKQTSEQIASNPTEHHLFIPLTLNNGILIGILQLTRTKSQEQFNNEDENKGLFIMNKFSIYGSCFYGASSKIIIASKLSQISTPKKTVDNIMMVLSPILKFKIADFWYYKPKQDEYAKFIQESGVFQVKYRCSIGIVAQALLKNTVVNLQQCGTHPNFSATPDIDPNIPLLIVTCEFNSTIWAMALRGRRDQERFSLIDEQLATVLMPYIARSIAFSSGFTTSTTRANESNDLAITTMLDDALDFVSTLDIIELINKIENKTKNIVNAEKIRVLIADQENKKFYCDFMNNYDTHKTFNINTGLAGKVYLTNSLIRCSGKNIDPDMVKELDVGNVEKINSLLLFPVIDQESGIVAVVSCINKVGDQFTESDESEAQSLSSILGVSLKNAQVYHRTLSIPAMFKSFNFEDSSDLQGIVDKMVEKSNIFTTKASAALYLIQGEELTLYKSAGNVPNDTISYAKNSISSNETKIYVIENQSYQEEEAPKQSSRSYVSSRTQNSMKCKVSKSVYCCCKLSYKDLDVGIVAFYTQSLATPSELQIIKTYVSMAISAIGQDRIRQLSDMWDKKKIIRRYVEDDDYSHFIPPSLVIAKDKFQSYPNKTIDDTFKIIITGFDTFGLFEFYKMPLQNFLMLILEISSRYGKGYRSLDHTLNTFKYLVKTLQYEELTVVTKQEIAALLIASLTIELDRPDFDSLGVVAIEALAECKGISVSNGLDAMKEICSKEECNIFRNISQFELKSQWNLIRRYVYATDMDKHFDIMDSFSSMMDEGEFDLEKEANRLEILELIMKCADFHDATKDYESIGEIKNNISLDFFRFGEIFRCKGVAFKGDPSRMAVNIEESNLGFFTYIVLPLFAAVAKVIAGVEPDVNAILSSIERWKEDSQKSNQGENEEEDGEVNENNEKEKEEGENKDEDNEVKEDKENEEEE